MFEIIDSISVFLNEPLTYTRLELTLFFACLMAIYEMSEKFSVYMSKRKN